MTSEMRQAVYKLQEPGNMSTGHGNFLIMALSLINLGLGR